MENAVRAEIYGPNTPGERIGKPLETDRGPITFTTQHEAAGPWHDKTTGEEVLTDSPPLLRYGIGVLHPKKTTTDPNHNTPNPTEETPLPGLPTNPDDNTTDNDTAQPPPKQRPKPGDSDSADFDLSDANTFKPSTMGITFSAHIPPTATLNITLSFATYKKLRVTTPTFSPQWWLRQTTHETVPVTTQKLLNPGLGLQHINTTDGPNNTKAELSIYSRPQPGSPDPQLRMITIVAINTTTTTGDEAALFQTHFTAQGAHGLTITPYPESTLENTKDPEQQSLALLYRNKQPFAIGHGCAADWETTTLAPVTWASADPLPTFELPSLTADITLPGQNQPLKISMAALAGHQPEGDLQVEQVLAAYQEWVNDRTHEIGTLNEDLQETAHAHMNKCQQALKRMRSGWALIKSDARAARAFQLANEAMLFQQIRSRLPRRAVTIANNMYSVAGSHPRPVPTAADGNWRPFQIAFILATVDELFDPTHPNRDVVDLIFFPTGGGKTEAYLGTAAFSMFNRRLRDPNDDGTDVLMRYTLRLLTAQQFVRAAALICVMENLRTQAKDLGTARFSIGIWLGRSTTPNTWTHAVASAKKLDKDASANNPFLLLRCPFCGTQMGPLKSSAKFKSAGYRVHKNHVTLFCPDKKCVYNNREGLPVHVVDQDIYETKPTLVIGTVDKFAQLTWRPEARALFGINTNGTREANDPCPPNLIIQDELHLIAGPLGSMVGMYEPIIEDLCTDHRATTSTKPKIVASTATIRQYEQQVRDLYGRERTEFFPPHGLEEGSSFFAETALTTDGAPASGRRYMGLFSASYGSSQTLQVRVAAATLQGGYTLPEDQRDGYWTNLNFLNSLRELGHTVSLLQSDVPDFMQGIKHRLGATPDPIRYVRNTLELTSRRRDDDIPKAIEELGTPSSERNSVDICLASNIIEVGVDIERLSLMTIVGQPKTTAQYIQVSGRVGRKWAERPGLVITLYAAARPRDRSHYERFRSYHERLYAQVEPTSLTPFARPVLERALHGAIVAHIRQTTPMNTPPGPYPAHEYTHAADLLTARARISDPATETHQALSAWIKRRSAEMKEGSHTVWSLPPGSDSDPNDGLMRWAGTEPDPDAPRTWATPTSMRNVDAACRLKISSAYVDDNVEDEIQTLGQDL